MKHGIPYWNNITRNNITTRWQNIVPYGACYPFVSIRNLFILISDSDIRYPISDQYVSALSVIRFRIAKSLSDDLYLRPLLNSILDLTGTRMNCFHKFTTSKRIELENLGCSSLEDKLKGFKSWATRTF